MLPNLVVKLCSLAVPSSTTLSSSKSSSEVLTGEGVNRPVVEERNPDDEFEE
jgi:hypothetical protein